MYRSHAGHGATMVQRKPMGRKGRELKHNAIWVTVCVSLSLLPHMLFGAEHKKGVGEYGQPRGARTLEQLRVSWYYDWKPRPDVAGVPAGVQFVPMIWGMKNMNEADLKAAKASGTGILLGFNEPNEKGQSNISVEQALDAWPRLEALHMRLGSPAPGTGDDVKSNGWLARFMAGAKARHYRVDFICIHPYQSSFDPDTATKDLIREVTTVHKMYHLPIWVTEYAMAEWGPPQKTPSAKIQAEFIHKSTAALEKFPFVERYAWYGDLPHQPTFSLADAHGNLTIVGNAWSAAPNSGGNLPSGR
jgi:hypothetical protein